MREGWEGRLQATLLGMEKELSMLIECGYWGQVQRREYGGWCRCMEGMAGEQESVDGRPINSCCGTYYFM